MLDTIFSHPLNRCISILYTDFLSESLTLNMYLSQLDCVIRGAMVIYYNACSNYPGVVVDHLFWACVAYW